MEKIGAQLGTAIELQHVRGAITTSTASERRSSLTSRRRLSKEVNQVSDLELMTVRRNSHGTPETEGELPGGDLTVRRLSVGEVVFGQPTTTLGGSIGNRLPHGKLSKVSISKPHGPKTNAQPWN